MILPLCDALEFVKPNSRELHDNFLITFTLRGEWQGTEKLASLFNSDAISWKTWEREIWFMDWPWLNWRDYQVRRRRSRQGDEATSAGSIFAGSDVLWFSAKPVQESGHRSRSPLVRPTGMKAPQRPRNPKAFTLIALLHFRRPAATSPPASTSAPRPYSRRRKNTTAKWAGPDTVQVGPRACRNLSEQKKKTKRSLVGWFLSFVYWA